jgi:endoribonuclease Dicer
MIIENQLFIYDKTRFFYIIDFLITCYIYENCGDLSPGELTDLRSALVNNVTFACLSVRLGLHTHMVARVCELSNIINRFVKHQENRHHAIGAEVCTY